MEKQTVKTADFSNILIAIRFPASKVNFWQVAVVFIFGLKARELVFFAEIKEDIVASYKVRICLY